MTWLEAEYKEGAVLDDLIRARTLALRDPLQAQTHLEHALEGMRQAHALWESGNREDMEGETWPDGLPLEVFGDLDWAITEFERHRPGEAAMHIDRAIAALEICEEVELDRVVAARRRCDEVAAAALRYLARAA